MALLSLSTRSRWGFFFMGAVLGCAISGTMYHVLILSGAADSGFGVGVGVGEGTNTYTNTYTNSRKDEYSYSYDNESVSNSSNSNSNSSTNEDDDGYEDEYNYVYVYAPSELEQFFIDNADHLGYNDTNDPATCDIWSHPNATNPSIHAKLTAYAQSLDDHTQAIEAFQPIPDLLTAIRKHHQQGNAHTHTHTYNDICKTARLGEHGVQSLFPDHLLSNAGGTHLNGDQNGSGRKSGSGSRSGFLEPLLPPMRHHAICTNFREHLMNMNYLVHDFEAMCHNLQPTSQRILIDMGASLSFHTSRGRNVHPIIWLIQLYEKFGFHFDHIYGFEKTFIQPEQVYGEHGQLPEEYMHSYHWINVGVEHNQTSKLNPLHSIVQKFNEEDLIIVKLDIDFSRIENPLAQELLEDKDGIYGKLIDQFYFEHHVHLGELKHNWGPRTGTIKDSLELFHGLRKKGIPAHFWP